jgi:hypothetical protein
MTALGWVLLVVLTAVVAWLGFAMIGLVREVAALREDLAALTRGPIELGGGLPIGSTPASWSLETADGTYGSASAAGGPHVVVFADTDCRTCDELVPAVVDAAGRGALPPVVVVGRDGSDLPAAWSGPGVVAGRERAREVSDAFDVDVSPHVFVLDEEGAVVAQGGVISLADVEALVRDAQGIRIVPGAEHG